MKEIVFVLFLIVQTLISETVINDSLENKIRPTFNLNSKGFILSSLDNNSISPFYHGSGLSHSLLTTKISNNIEIPLRFVVENWNYSELYDSPENMKIWGKVALKVNIPVDNIISNIKIQAGDLWRVKNGYGLTLDNFEAQGSNFNITFVNGIEFDFKTLGVGWKYVDDIYLYSLKYKDIVSINLLNNFLNDDISFKILSVDNKLKINKYLTLYNEIGYNFFTSDFAMLSKVEFLKLNKRNRIKLGAEFRTYSYYFLNHYEGTNYPYFNSLTSIDKPYNNFRTYQVLMGGTQLNFDIDFRIFLYDDFFINSNSEFIIGNTITIPYELTIGYDINNTIQLHLGLLNKFFNLYKPDETNQMFNVRDVLWYLIKIEYNIDYDF